MAEYSTIEIRKQPTHERVAEFYFCPNYQDKGPRVLLLVGSKWRDTMRRHYGARRPAFFTRPALSHEPDAYPNGHPWGWVYKPNEVLLEESRWSPPNLISNLQQNMEAEMTRALQGNLA